MINNFKVFYMISLYSKFQLNEVLEKDMPASYQDELTWRMDEIIMIPSEALRMTMISANQIMRESEHEGLEIRNDTCKHKTWRSLSKW